MSSELIEIPPEMEAVGKVRESAMSLVKKSIASGDKFTRDLAIAYGLTALRKAFTPQVVGLIAGLGGTAIGWRHDKETRGETYSPDVIRDCAIEALLRGVSLTGNEFNILAGRCYITREGYEVLLSSYPGLTDLECFLGIPEDARGWGNQEMVFITAMARCKVNGKPIVVECRKGPSFDGRIAVKSYKGEFDQAKGKAKRRLMKLLYERITGSSFSEPADETAIAGDIIEVEASEPQKKLTSVVDWEQEKSLLKSPRAIDCWHVLEKCDSVERLNTIMKQAAKEDMAGPCRDKVNRFAEYVLQQVQA